MMGLLKIKLSNDHISQVIDVTHLYKWLIYYNAYMLYPRSHAIEMVFVFIVTGHAGSSARSFMLSQKMFLFQDSGSQIRFNLRSLSVQIYISIAGERGYITSN